MWKFWCCVCVVRGAADGARLTCVLHIVVDPVDLLRRCVTCTEATAMRISQNLEARDQSSC